jgi:hypothetical protein
MYTPQPHAQKLADASNVLMQPNNFNTSMKTVQLAAGREGHSSGPEVVEPLQGCLLTSKSTSFTLAYACCSCLPQSLAPLQLFDSTLATHTRLPPALPQPLLLQQHIMPARLASELGTRACLGLLCAGSCQQLQGSHKQQQQQQPYMRNIKQCCRSTCLSAAFVPHVVKRSSEQ